MGKGYSVTAPGQIVEEIAAYIFEGSWEEFGLTKEEAKSYLKLWVKSYTQRNGAQSKEIFLREYQEAQTLIRRAAEETNVKGR